MDIPPQDIPSLPLYKLYSYCKTQNNIKINDFIGKTELLLYMDRSSMRFMLTKQDFSKIEEIVTKTYKI